MLRTIYPGVLGSFCQALSEHNQLHHVQQSGPVQLLAGVVRASTIGVLSLYSFATLCIPLPPLVIRTRMCLVPLVAVKHLPVVFCRRGAGDSRWDQIDATHTVINIARS